MELSGKVMIHGNKHIKVRDVVDFIEEQENYLT